jgi:5-bromo-4-chloroindolyl phosphate hydrolysis protein
MKFKHETAVGYKRLLFLRKWYAISKHSFLTVKQTPKRALHKTHLSMSHFPKFQKGTLFFSNLKFFRKLYRRFKNEDFPKGQKDCFIQGINFPLLQLVSPFFRRTSNRKVEISILVLGGQFGSLSLDRCIFSSIGAIKMSSFYYHVSIQVMRKKRAPLSLGITVKTRW